MMMDDPIVDEIRRLREEHAARFNYDLDAIVADIQESQAVRDWPRANLEPQRVARRDTKASLQVKRVQRIPGSDK